MTRLKLTDIADIKKYKRNSSIKVLDKGFVTLIDYMGNDQRVVDAARVSFKSEKHKTELSNIGLINYLMKNGHTSPFEQCEVTFHIKAPIFVLRQIMRHRTFNINEISARYIELEADYYIPKGEDINTQSVSNKQGRSNEVVENIENIKKLIENSNFNSFHTYKTLIENNKVAKELSRSVIPVGSYSEIWLKGDLNNLFKFFVNRLDEHCQLETYLFAKAMFELIFKIFPITMKSFLKNILFSINFTYDEVMILINLFNAINAIDKRGKTILSKTLKMDIKDIVNIHKSYNYDRKTKILTNMLLDKLSKHKKNSTSS